MTWLGVVVCTCMHYDPGKLCVIYMCLLYTKWDSGTQNLHYSKVPLHIIKGAVSDRKNCQFKIYLFDNYLLAPK